MLIKSVISHLGEILPFSGNFVHSFFFIFHTLGRASGLEKTIKNSIKPGFGNIYKRGVTRAFQKVAGVRNDKIKLENRLIGHDKDSLLRRLIQ